MRDFKHEKKEGMNVKNVIEVAAIWDEADRDGYCLKEEFGATNRLC